MKKEKESSLEYIVSFDDLPERELLKPCILNWHGCPPFFCWLANIPNIK